MELVSIILPTFNRAHVLERALNSVAAQTDPHWELIVVDDGSTDNSKEVFSNWLSERNLPQRVEWFRVAHGGVSRARNLGVREAQGEWLSFLDSDDEWQPDKLRAQRPLTDRFAWVHGEEIWIRNGVRVNPMKRHKKSGGRIFKRSVDLCCVSPSTVMIRRELFEKFGGFREDFPVCEDYDLWLKISAVHEVGFVEKPIIVKYGGHADQLSRKYVAMDRFRCLSLTEQMANPALSTDERHHVRETLRAKSRILVDGFLKRQR